MPRGVVKIAILGGTGFLATAALVFLFLFGGINKDLANLGIIFLIGGLSSFLSHEILKRLEAEDVHALESASAGLARRLLKARRETLVVAVILLSLGFLMIVLGMASLG